MVRRAAHEAAVKLRPSGHRLSLGDQLVVAGRHLPCAVRPAPVADVKGHQLDVLGLGLEVVEAGSHLAAIGEGGMIGDASNALTVEKDLPIGVERRQVHLSVFDLRSHRVDLPTAPDELRCRRRACLG